MLQMQPSSNSEVFIVHRPVKGILALFIVTFLVSTALIWFFVAEKIPLWKMSKGWGGPILVLMTGWQLLTKNRAWYTFTAQGITPYRKALIPWQDVLSVTYDSKTTAAEPRLFSFDLSPAPWNEIKTGHARGRRILIAPENGDERVRFLAFLTQHCSPRFVRHL